MPAPADFLSALGMAFTGYGKDQQQRVKNEAAQQQQQMQSQLHGAQMGEYQAQAEERRAKMAAAANRQQVLAMHGRAAIQGDPDAIQAVISVAPELAGTLTKEPPKGQYDSERGVIVNQDGSVIVPKGLPAKPAGPPKEHWVSAGVDKDGQPVILNSVTGETKIGGGLHGGPGGPSASAQSQQARQMAAMSEARLADERMRKYEDGLLGGTTSISPLEQAAGSLSSNLSGTHSVLGAGVQAASEFGLNKTAPDYQQYLRDAATIGRAEQMMAPRGGNETMVRANSLLARAGSGATEATINASRMARQALFGPSGGIAQTLTPGQTQKLEQGVERIKSGEHGASVAKPSLSVRVQQLKAQGLSKEAARAQLQQEGYDLHGGD